MPSMSVLRGPHPQTPLAKVIGGPGPAKGTRPKYWDSIERVDLPFTLDLYLLLLNLEKDPYACLVPGHPGEANPQGKWRRALQALPVKRNDPEGDKDPAGLIAGPGGSVLILDHDSGEFPRGTDKDTDLPVLAKALARYYCRVAGLPDLVSGVVQFSGSHGVKGCRAKLFFLFEAGQRWKAIHDYCCARLGTDQSVSSPAQIIYTAAPVIEGDGVDPLGGADRTYLIEGKVDRWPGIQDADTDVDAWKRLHKARQELLALPVGEPRHPVINQETWQCGRYVAAGRLDKDVVADWIESACNDSEAIGPGRTDRDEILRAIDDGNKSPAASREAVASLDLTNTGSIKPVLGNAVALLDNVKVLLNDFGDLEIIKAPPWAVDKEPWPRVVDDGQVLRAALWLHAEHRVSFSTREVMDAFRVKGALNPVDRLTEYLDRVAELPEGRVTVDNIALIGWGAEDTEAHRMGTAKFFIQAVRRAYEPGCKAELVLILHGAPGIGKTRSIRALFIRPGEKYFASSHIPISNQQLYAPILRGLWGAELAEQRAVSQYNNDLFKTFLSLQTIKYRAPYDRTASEISLRSNYVWSTESATPLNDSNYRRMVLVEVRGWGELSGEDIDVFWGSAVRAYRAGRPAWINEEEAIELREVREAALQVDPLTEAVEELLHNSVARDVEQPQIWVLDRLAMNQKFGIKVSDASAKDRVGKIMGRLGWVSKIIRRPRSEGGGGTRRTWIPPEGWKFYDTTPPGGEVVSFPGY